MAKSWGHTVERMSVEERDYHWSMGWRCSAPKCRQMAEYDCRYNYVTGRGGRVSSQNRTLCLIHAVRFAGKNSVAMPEAE